MSIATLDINLVARLASLESGLDRAGRLAEKEAAQIERAFSGMKVAAAGLGGVIAGAFSATAMQQFFMATVDGIDELNDLSDATGASIENISALEDIAARGGTSFDSMSDSLVKLNQFLKETDPGSQQAEVLKAIGLSAKELKDLDPAEALLKIATALQGYADNGNKARIVQEIFGKNVKEVAPFLKDLAEKGKLVATVTKEQADEAKKFNDQLAELSKNAKDVAREISGPLLKALNDAAPRFKELFGGEKSKYTIGTELQLAQSELQKLNALRGKGFTVAGFFGSEEEREREIAKLEAQVKRLQIALAGFGTGAGEQPAGKVLLPSPDKPDRTKPGKEQKRRAESPAFVGPELPEATKAAIDALSSSDLAKAKQITAAVAELDSLFASGRVDAQEYAAAIEKLRGKDVAGPILPDEEVARINRLNARLGTLTEKFEKAADEMTAFSEEAARNIQDALGDTVLATLEGDFDSIEDSWKRMLNRLVSEAIAADIGKALFGNGKPSLEGAAGQIGKLFGGASSLFDGVAGAIGTYFGAENPSSAYAVNGSDFGFKLAEGTNFVPYDGMPATLHRGEAVVPAKYNPANGGAGGASPVQNNTFYIDGRMDQAATAQLISQALQANNRALEERMNAQGRR